MWKDVIERPLLVRFETQHSVGKKRYTGNWYIADIDNFFASQLF